VWRYQQPQVWTGNALFGNNVVFIGIGGNRWHPAQSLAPSPLLPKLSPVCSLIGTIPLSVTSQESEVMGTRWRRAAPEPLFSSHQCGFPSGPRLILSVCCRRRNAVFYLFIAFGFQYNCRGLNQCAFNSTPTSITAAAIDRTGSVVLSYDRWIDLASKDCALIWVKWAVVSDSLCRLSTSN